MLKAGALLIQRRHVIRKSKNLALPSFNIQSLLNHPILAQILLPLNAILMARGAKGFGGGALGGVGAGTAGKAKALIVVIILVLIVPFIALLFSGATTGSTGLYGNASIAYAVRQSTFNFAQFIVLVLVLGALGIVLALL